MEIEQSTDASQARPKICVYVPTWEERWVQKRLGRTTRRMPLQTGI